MTQSPTAASGISNLPTLLAYHEPPTYISSDNPLKFLTCYIMRHYGSVVRSCLIVRRPADDTVTVLIGDQDGHILDNTKVGVQYIVNEIAPKLINLMRMIKLTKALYFFSNADAGYRLVDIQLEPNKFASPGMVLDVFSKVILGPELLANKYINDAVHEAIISNTGSFEGDIIIKPARPRLVPIGKTFMPLMAQVKR